MSADLWDTFTTKLQRAGYSLDDIAHCTDHVFLSVVAELGGFTALQTAKLQTEMKTRVQGAAAPSLMMLGSRAGSRSGTPTNVGGSSTSNVLNTIRPDSSEFDAVVGRFTPFLRSCGVTAVVQTIVKCLDDADALDTKQIGFRWVPYDTALNLLQEHPSAASLFALLRGDPLCSSGLVLQTDLSPRVPVADAFGRHPMLFVFSIVNSPRAKLMQPADVKLLSQLSTPECHSSITDEGADCIEVQGDAFGINADNYRAAGSFVFFHPQFVQLKYAISFETASVAPAPVVHAPLTSSRSASVTDYQRPPSTMRCVTHPAKTVEFWCPPEKKLLCSHCLFHDGYNKKACLLIEDAAKIEYTGLQNWSKNAATFLRDIRSVEQLFSAAVSEVEDDAQQQIQEARTFFHNLRKAIDVSEDRVVEEIQTKSRDEVTKLERASSAVNARVGEIDDIHSRAQRALASDRWDSSTAAQLLRLVEQAFGKWDVTTLPTYELTSVHTKSFPAPSQITGATNQCFVRREGSVNLPEAIDVNFLQQVHTVPSN